MLTRQYSLEQMPGYGFDRSYDLAKIVFFDIETTGFAAEASFLYLIGCAYYKDSTFHMIQWFSEGIREEELLLTTFFEFLKDYEILVHYNGSGFDIPYLQKKCSLLKLNYSFDRLTSIDIYKKLLPYKKIFRLKSFKLKSLEEFLNIKRKDTYSGGDLIQVYQSYLGKKNYENLRKLREPAATVDIPSQSELLLQELLLHNEDDIRGLLYVSPILNYVDLFETPIRILQASVDKGVFMIRFEVNVYLPVPVSFGNDLAHLNVCDNTVTLTIHTFEGELKYYYENYKDYYYLPAEDYAVHKSLASFVDKDYRVKAKPSTCYIKKQGIFAPQYEVIITPCFKNSHVDKLSFLEIHTDLLLKEETLERYVGHMMKHILIS